MNFATGFHNTVSALCTVGQTTFQPGAFSCRRPPPIPLPDYAARLQAFMHCSDSAFVVASIFLARLFKADPTIFGPLSAHKLMITVITVAAKWSDDVFFTNTHYADVGGVKLTELNKLELELLRVLDWGVFITTNLYEQGEAWMRCASQQQVVTLIQQLTYDPPQAKMLAGTEPDDWELSYTTAPADDFSWAALSTNDQSATALLAGGELYRSAGGGPPTKRPRLTDSNTDTSAPQSPGEEGEAKSPKGGLLRLRHHPRTPTAPGLGPSSLPNDMEPLSTLTL